MGWVPGGGGLGRKGEAGTWFHLHGSVPWACRRELVRRRARQGSNDRTQYSAAHLRKSRGNKGPAERRRTYLWVQAEVDVEEVLVEEVEGGVGRAVREDGLPRRAHVGLPMDAKKEG